MTIMVTVSFKQDTLVLNDNALFFDGIIAVNQKLKIGQLKNYILERYLFT
jgi:hypothetical protein